MEREERRQLSVTVCKQDCNWLIKPGDRNSHEATVEGAENLPPWLSVQWVLRSHGQEGKHLEKQRDRRRLLTQLLQSACSMTVHSFLVTDRELSLIAG